jgi:hypothetical protein
MQVMLQNNNTCPNCGGTIEGDGYTTALHCEFVEWDDYMYREPDYGVVYYKADENS